MVFRHPRWVYKIGTPSIHPVPKKSSWSRGVPSCRAVICGIASVNRRLFTPKKAWVAVTWNSDILYSCTPQKKCQRRNVLLQLKTQIGRYPHRIKQLSYIIRTPGQRKRRTYKKRIGWFYEFLPQGTKRRLVTLHQLTWPLKIGHPKRKRESIPTIHFQVLQYVSFREGNWGTLRDSVWEDWGTLGKIRRITTPGPLTESY